MINQLSKLFSRVHIPKSTPVDPGAEALRATKKLLAENLKEMDTFIRQDMPQIRKANEEGLKIAQKLSESSQKVLSK